MKRLRILLVLTALMMGASAFASAEETRNQRGGHQDQYLNQHFDRDRGNGVQYRYPVYDKDSRGRDRDDRWKVKDRDDRGRHEYGDRR